MDSFGARKQENLQLLNANFHLHGVYVCRYHLIMNSLTFFTTGICLICVIFIDSLFSSRKDTGRKIRASVT